MKINKHNNYTDLNALTLDNINIKTNTKIMTNEEMEKLSDLIVDKITNKQKELDKEFIQDLELANVPIEVHQKIDQKDKIIMEITRLHVLLQGYETDENYELAIKCTQKITDLKHLLNDISSK